MKKTLIKLCSVAAIGLALTACNNDAANKVAQDSDNTAIDQMVQDRVKSLDDSLAKVCEEKVTLAATEKASAEAPKGGTHATAKPAAKPAPKPETKKEDPKPGGLKGKSDQSNTAPGGGLKSKSDQATPAQGGGGLRGKKDQK